jgi:hypothetical protein
MPDIGDTCPECGMNIATPGHFVVCPEKEQQFDGTCAMCGEAYESFFEHLSECEARGGGQTTVASTDGETEWDEEPLGEL